MKKIFLIITIISFQVLSQTKILFTSINYEKDDVRAVICNGDGSNIIDLGFNKTYLPVWFGEEILLNSNTFIWKCDTAGNHLTKIYEGFRPSVSNDISKFAFYYEDGIAIANKKGEVIKKIEYDAWEDITITWTKNDSNVTFYDPYKRRTMIFNLKKDSISIFSDSVYHPLWHKRNDLVLYNKFLPGGTYGVFIGSGLRSKPGDRRISDQSEDAIVPVWNNMGDKIAYLRFIENPNPEIYTDMIYCELVLLDLKRNKKEVLANDAGFTDQAFPQISFSSDDKFIYYTAINKNGLGSLKKIDLKTKQISFVSKDQTIDQRFPHVKTF